MPKLSAEVESCDNETQQARDKGNNYVEGVYSTITAIYTLCIL